METKVNPALVGAFVLVLGAALIAGVLWLASGGGLQKKYDLYQALVDESVAGLNLKAPVKYRGVDVGHVRQIRLDPSNPEQVQLLFAIERGTPVKEDTEAVLRTQGLTGIAYVELDGGSRTSPPLRASAPGQYPLIRTKPSLSARLENVMTTVMTKLDQTSDNVDRLLDDENLAAVKHTLADLSALAHTLAERQDSIDAGIRSATRAFDHGERVTAQLSRDLGPMLERVGRSADAIRVMGEQAALASAGAARTIDAVGQDVRHLGTDTLPQLQALLGEMTLLSTSLRRLAEETERNPRGFLLGRKAVPDGPGEGAARARP
jgi:phospholipid/cholesterol/gamma-HCH transport system substrate-binding protein